MKQDKTIQFLISKNLDKVFLALLKSLNPSFENVQNSFEVKLNQTNKSFFKWMTNGIGLIVNPFYTFTNNQWQ